MFSPEFKNPGYPSHPHSYPRCWNRWWMKSANRGNTCFNFCAVGKIKVKTQPAFEHAQVHTCGFVQRWFPPPEIRQFHIGREHTRLAKIAPCKRIVRCWYSCSRGGGIARFTIAGPETQVIDLLVETAHEFSSETLQRTEADGNTP